MPNLNNKNSIRNSKLNITSLRAKIRNAQKEVPEAPFTRGKQDYLITVPGEITRLPIEDGAFNAGLVKYKDKYICVYRPDEYAFKAVILNKNLEIEGEHFDFGITNCADPRIVWVGNKLLLIYSSIDEGISRECIRGAIIMDLDESDNFIKAKPFKVSPKTKERQKNWMPFVIGETVYLIASVQPHIIYELDITNPPAVKAYETDFINPWFCGEFLRGNTNPVLLDDGNFLGTFHTVIKHGRLHLYDNGCYVFEGKPPFKVIRSGKRTYMPAESAVEPHFRKKGLILVNFPVGMVREGNDLLISYGDNDSAVKILKTTVKDMLSTTVFVY